MSKQNGSQWWTRSWSPVTGCTPVSAGCENCWAKRQANRKMGEWGEEFHEYLRGFPGSNLEEFVKRPRRFSDVVCHPDRLDQPLHWRKPQRVAVSLMGDLFHEQVPLEFLGRVWRVMEMCPQHTFILCTKRAERLPDVIDEFIYRGTADPGDITPNVQVLVSAENQEEANRRIPYLLGTQMIDKRGVSLEPLLGPVDLTKIKIKVTDGFFGDPLQWHHRGKIHADQGIKYQTLNWVIVGGESGPHARPCSVEWIRDIRDQCKAAGVRCFVKQLGARPAEGTIRRCSGLNSIRDRNFREVPDTYLVDPGKWLRLKSRSGSDPAEWPEAFPREFP